VAGGARILVFATRNQGKLRELRALAAGLPVEILSIAEAEARGMGPIPEVDEDRGTFEGNAEKKAVSCARASGQLSLADDSGLVVDALDGAPGVDSAIYAGRHGDDRANNDQLLASLAGVEDARRTARFVCVLCLCDPAREGAVDFARGTCEGRVAWAPQGENGFGYDPLFYLPDLARTMAELAPGEKAGRSHRGNAMRALVRSVLAPLLARSP
jgi:XTP/dITP diphosphohydrolase